MQDYSFIIYKFFNGGYYFHLKNSRFFIANTQNICKYFKIKFNMFISQVTDKPRFNINPYIRKKNILINLG